MKPPPCFDDPQSKRLILSLCEEHGVDATLLKDLCDLIQQHSGSGRKPHIDAEMALAIDRFLERNPKF